jgi:hypothetical protein
MQMRFGARACCHVIKRSYKNAGCQQLWKRFSLRLLGSVDHVEWNAEPCEVAQIHRNRWIWPRPIRTHSDDVRLVKTRANFIVLEHRQFIDFAGQAPSGGDVHEDSFAFADQALQRDRVKGLPSGFGRGLEGRRSRRDTNDERSYGENSSRGTRPTAKDGAFPEPQ